MGIGIDMNHDHAIIYGMLAALFVGNVLFFLAKL